MGGVIVAPAADAASYVPISGSGSTWSQDLLDDWRRTVGSDGLTVHYSGTGSSAGRSDFVRGSVDFAVSEVPFQTHPGDGSAPETSSRPYTYIPLAAGGTALAYHLVIDGRRVRDLQLSGGTVAGIFTGRITRWNDPAIAADNPALSLPDRAITPVVRADSSGSTALFTHWLATEHPGIWTTGDTSVFPTSGLSQFTTRSGSLGVAGYVSQSYGEGSITYVEYSYAQKSGLPVASVRNAAGNYVQPSAPNVEIALRAARLNDDATSADDLAPVLDGVYQSPEPTAYPISSYSMLIAPITAGGVFTAAQGDSLRAFVAYALGAGQTRAEPLGYAPLPAQLIAAGLVQAARIPSTQTGPGVPTPSTRGLIGVEAEVVPAADGPLSLEVPVTEPAELAPPEIVDGRSVSRGTLPDFSVVDGRVLSRPGYTVRSTVSDFTAGDSILPAGSLTVSPRVVSAGTTSTGVVAAEPFAARAEGSDFATAIAGGGVGTTLFGTELRLEAPRGTPGGTYRATMTLTVVSR